MDDRQIETVDAVLVSIYKNTMGTATPLERNVSFDKFFEPLKQHVMNGHVALKEDFGSDWELLKTLPRHTMSLTRQGIDYVERKYPHLKAEEHT